MPTRNWEPYVSMRGLASLGMSGLTYLMARSMGAESRALNSVQCLNSLNDVLQHASRLPLKVAIRGRAGSRRPKFCELSGEYAVMHEELEEEVMRGWGLTFDHGAWFGLSPRETSRITDEVEWYLEDGAPVTVAVEKGLDAQHVRSAMQTRSAFKMDDPFTAAARFFMENILRLSMGPFAALVVPTKGTGVSHGFIFTSQTRRTETLLPVNSLVTVVGELDAFNNSSSAPLDDRGAPIARRLIGGGSGVGHQHPSYVVRKPAGGNGPFIISPLTFEELKAKASRGAAYQVLPAAFGVLAVVLLVGKAAAAWLGDRRDRRQRRQHLAAVAARTLSLRQQQAGARGPHSHDDAGRGGGWSGRGIRQQGSERGTATSSSEHGMASVEGVGGGDVAGQTVGQCAVCLDRGAEMVFPACGHLCCCADCGRQLNRCPMCRIRSTPIKVYWPTLS